MSLLSSPSAVGGAVLLACCAVQAQAPAPAATPAAAPAPSSRSQNALPAVTVTGNPLGTAEPLVPVESLAGPQLLLRGQSSLGATLEGLPGVAGTWFGPNANRPVIRGLDGDRIRILENGGASHDVSGLSFDHASTVDPIAVERIEVLRGPGALLYGGSAVGGVVNVIDNRIPRTPVQGVTGRLDASHATGARENAGAAMLEAGNGRLALHVDGFHRDSGDVRVPAALACTQGGAPRLARRLCNSASDTRGGAVGGTAFLDRGHVGASVSTFRKDYGTVAEDDVTIGMRSDRYALEGVWRPRAGWFESVKLQGSHTDYRHTEFEAGAPGTRFASRGNDWRLEARHRPLGPLQGVVGLQGEHTRFSADGQEAFAPRSRTRQRALFVYEELAATWGRLSAGARAEDVQVQSFGGADPDRFATGTRRFRPVSYALGARWDVAPSWQLVGNVAHTERAPRDYELFANGPHLASAAYEIGNPALGKERSDNLDLSLQWKSGPHRARVGAFLHRFRNYVALESTGVQVGEGDEALPQLAYRQVPARLHGLEAGGTVRLHAAGPVLDLEWRADTVRATNRATGEPLPRIAPARLGVTLLAAQGPWSLRVGADRMARQDRVPAGERPVPGYTLWHAVLGWRQQAGLAELLWYARIDNAGNRLAESATSILTQTAPGRAPLPGRSLRVGVQANF